MTFYFVVALLGHYGGPDSAFGQVQAFFSGIGASLDPSVAPDARSYDLATVSIVMVVLLVALMMTGMTLGIVNLIVSVLMVIDRKRQRMNSSQLCASRMPSSALQQKPH